MIGVYIKVDEKNNITEIDSDIFISDLFEWIKIDEGSGYRFSHAQNNYLEKPIHDEYGRYNYQYSRKKIKEIPEADKPEIVSDFVITESQRIDALENALEELIEMIMEG